MNTYTAKELKGIKMMEQLKPNDMDELLASRKELRKKWYRNDSYHYRIVDENGTRYVEATRKNDFDGRRSFASTWYITYGKIGWRFERTNNPMGTEYEPTWVRAGKHIGKSANGTIVPQAVFKKSDVITIVKQIGIFNI